MYGALEASVGHLINYGHKMAALPQLHSEVISSLPLLRALKQEWPRHCHCCEDTRCSQPSHQLQ